MTSARMIAAACAVSLFSMNAALAQDAGFPAPAASATGEYKPISGQAGKDVVWVPTPQALVDGMLDMAKVTPDDYLVDLGSGDGRTVITAAKRGIRAHGIEYNPDLVKLSQQNAKAEGVEGKATFEQADIFKTDFSKATVVTLFLLPSLNERLRPTLLDMKPGTRVVANSFDMKEWKPDQEFETRTDCTSWCKAMMWIVPAKVEGNWKMDDGTLALEQSFQMLTGTLTLDGKEHALSEAKMTGAQISFTAGGQAYTGEVDGNAMSVKAGNGAALKATKAGK
jgi:hypothetical protein